MVEQRKSQSREWPLLVALGALVLIVILGMIYATRPRAIDRLARYRVVCEELNRARLTQDKLRQQRPRTSAEDRQRNDEASRLRKLIDKLEIEKADFDVR
jgi:hypothetical protein